MRLDNRSGGGGTIGTQLGAKATPDGYTMVLCNLGLSYASALYPDLPYDPRRDLAPVCAGSHGSLQPQKSVVIP